MQLLPRVAAHRQVLVLAVPAALAILAAVHPLQAPVPAVLAVLAAVHRQNPPHLRVLATVPAPEVLVDVLAVAPLMHPLRLLVLSVLAQQPISNNQAHLRLNLL